MVKYNYTGHFLLGSDPISSDTPSPAPIVHPGYIRFGNFSSSNGNLVQYKSMDYMVLLDGSIYEFDHQPFSKDQYPRFIDLFEKDPAGALRKLDGEFVAIIVDQKRSTSVVATSESGASALFYRKEGDALHIGNNIRETAGEDVGSGDVDFQRIYDTISGSNLGSERTPFQAVKRLLPGHYLIVRNGEVAVCEYSDLYALDSPLVEHPGTYDRFRELFRNSVRKRISGKTCIALSSGLDSTSVAAMAAEIQMGLPDQINAYTFRPNLLSKEMLASRKFDETILLKSFLDKYPGIISKTIEPEQGSLWDSLERTVRIYGEAVYGASNQFWIQTMHREAKADGCITFLTGQGGNYTISWPPPEMVNRGRKGAKYFLKRFYGNRIPQKVFPYLSRDFVHHTGQEHFQGHHRSESFSQKQTSAVRNTVSYTGYLMKQICLEYGFTVTDPTVDKDIIRYCLSLPWETFHTKDGSRKLVTYGLRDMLPAEILENRTRSIQAADIHHRMQFEKQVIGDNLRFLNKNNLVTFVLDIDKLLKDWESIDFLSMHRKELNHLLRIIVVAIFLSKVK